LVEYALDINHPIFYTFKNSSFETYAVVFSEKLLSELWYNVKAMNKKFIVE